MVYFHISAHLLQIAYATRYQPVFPKAYRVVLSTPGVSVKAQKKQSEKNAGISAVRHIQC